MEDLLLQAVQLAKEAGNAIMAIYSQSDLGTTLKADDSPLTRADIASHQVISERLNQLTPNQPLLSEESAVPPYSERETWASYWLVDPLDGTKEFIKRTGEFTVNIALMEKNKPVLGVVHIPALRITFFALRGAGAFKEEFGKPPSRIYAGDYRNKPLKIVYSRSHKGADLDQFLKKFKDYESVSIGSSIKFCLIAEGKAHFYPRLYPTMEWDTAAGDCIVTEAGGSVTDLDRRPLQYNKPKLENPSFVVCGNPPFPWWI